MLPAAIRLAVIGAGLALLGAPTRPSPPIASVRIGDRDYVRAVDVAAKLGMAMRWTEPGRLLMLSDSGHRLEFSVGGRTDDREIGVDGLSVYLGDPAVVRSGELYVSKIDLEHRLVPLLRPGWGGAIPPRPRVIVIDPGHGGDDPGTQNFRLHLKEKVFTLDVGLRLRKLLEEAGYRVIMTRTSDTKLAREQGPDLRLRAEVANQTRADLFVSIHFNAGAPSDFQSHGSEIYTFSPEYQRSSRSWSMHMNDAEQFASPANRNDHWNVVFARAMHRALVPFLRTEDRGERINQLGVLRSLNCPGILVESAFLSNDAEARRVMDPAFRQQIAEAMLAGIRAYSAELDALRPKPAG